MKKNGPTRQQLIDAMIWLYQADEKDTPPENVGKVLSYCDAACLITAQELEWGAR